MGYVLVVPGSFNVTEHIFSFKGFTAKCLIQPIQINEYTEPVDIETIFSDNQNSREIQRQMYSSPKMHANLRMYIPYYDKLGVFD